jgi:hypothetical protein
MIQPMLALMGSPARDDNLALGSSDRWELMPQVDLRHFLKMTDCTGMFQHALYSVPDLRHGYCIDDNARALIAALYHVELFGEITPAVPIHRYLMFLAYAYNESTGAFRNFMAYDRRWLEEVGSPDSQGRTIWALGVTVSAARDDGTRDLAEKLFSNALPGVSGFKDLRSKAFTVLGLEQYLKQFPGHAVVIALRDQYASELFAAFASNASDDWPWCEDIVTYDNAKLCHALLIAGKSMGREDMIELGLRSLRWLLDVQRAPKGHLSIIGNAGWLRRGGIKADFDQQPLEAYALVHACLEAAGVSGDSEWADEAWRCFQWFVGGNDLGVMLYSPDDGGCMDGLRPNGANRNQGAESTLAYLLSVLELHRYRESLA